MRRERVTKNVWTNTFGDPRPAHRSRNLLLDHRLVQVKARRWTPLRIAADPRGEDSNARGVNGNQNDNSLDESGAAYVFTR